VSVVAVTVLVAACGPNPLKWTTILPVTPPNTTSSELFGIAAVSSTNIYAVGDYQPAAGSAQALIERYTGTTTGGNWGKVPSASITIPGNGASALLGIAAVSGSNIYAVGYYTLNGVRQGLIEHYNGTSWSPSLTIPGSGASGLSGIAAVTVAGTTNIWAVGFYTGNGTHQPLIEHSSNGTSWARMSITNLSAGSNYGLSGVAAVSANDVWAVGAYSDNGYVKTLIVHYSNGGWSPVMSPNPGNEEDELYSITALATDDVWAVGSDRGSNFCCNIYEQTLIEHYDGTANPDGTPKWAKVPSPFPGTMANGLTAIAAVSANDIWAAGYRRDVGSVNQTGVNQTLLLHYSGKATNYVGSWGAFDSPNVGALANGLNAITAVPGTKDVWAVGYSGIGPQTSQMLILHGA
jgi:hypothetical protein